MRDFSKETDARIVIDDLLRQAGWDPADKSQIETEVSVRDIRGHIGDPPVPYGKRPSLSPDDGDEVPSGRADYVLLDQRGRPLAVIEAKRSAIQPYTAKQQALPYAKQLQAPFIFLTNGELIYFWGYTNDDARIVNSFYSRRDLERLVHMRQERKPLATIAIPEYYLRQGEQRAVRPYQQETMRALDHAVELGKRRFLIELPTGTGKTDLVCLYLKRLLEAGRAERVLFLVDREQLAKQALEAMQDILDQYGSYWLKPSMERQEQQLTVCLLQTMISRYPEFTSGYFDVVIADECHRSIYGAWQTALTHFDALHIGLTATPADYIERNTFHFYQCREGQPDFAYPIQQAFQEGYLVPYRFATGITVLLAEGADLDEERYDPAEFERKWTNEDTNRMMVEEFDRLAWQNYMELAPRQSVRPGKTIVFAITKRHAARLAYYLNELHPEHKGRYAEVITSDVADADALIRRFKYENYPQVAVSVGMLDTGFDCREVLHLVLCRRVRSPILYQQMRGRGTRTAPHIGKRWLEQRRQTIEEVKTAIPTLQTYRKGPGEKLPDWNLLEHSIYGIDVSRQMMRIAMMNLVLHGIRNAGVKRANALSELGGLTEEDLRHTYKVILSSPPFAGALPRDSIRQDLPTTSKKSELLFLGVMMQALAPGGRCAVVVPEGLLFGSTKAHVELRRKLLEDYELLAIVSLPAGVFKPYAGVKTGVLVFRKPASSAKGAQSTKNVWFYEVRNDGYDPDKIVGGGRPETPEKNNIPDLLRQWQVYKASGFTAPPGVEAGTLLQPDSEEPRC